MERRSEYTKKTYKCQQTREKILKITNYQRNTNQNHKESTSYLLEWLSSKRPQITNVGEDVENRKPS